MTFWPSSSIPALANIGQTYSWLHSLPLASGFLSVLYLLVTAANRHRKLSNESRETGSSITKSGLPWWKKTWRGKEKGDVLASALVVLAVVSWVSVAYIVQASPKFVTYTYHDVEVLRQYGTDDWDMVIDGQKLNFNCCVGESCSKYIWPGYIMDTLRYEQKGDCASITDPDAHPPLGAFWKRVDGDVVKIKQEIR